MLQNLIGKTVESVTFDNGYYTVRFSDGSGMHIINYVGDYESKDNIGSRIMKVDELDEEIDIRLDTQNTLTISLRDNDYVGPEAFQYFDPSGGLFMVG